VLCVAADLPHPFPADFRYMGVPVLDSPDVDLRPHFDAAFEFMEHAVSSSGGVLVHCFAGRSRSVTICVGYLMRYQTMTLHSALAAVQALRPCAQPNVGFMANLERFEQEEARSRAHGHATRSSTRLTCA
jgi:protein-tyrosine phosphatase